MAMPTLADALSNKITGLVQVIVFAVLSLLLVQEANALGKDGHEAVCYIAYAQASPQTREKINALIRLDPEYSQIEDPAEAYARSCVWADKVKRKDGRSKEHYVNVPRATKKIMSLDCPEADKCLLSAIVTDAAVLRDPDASDEDKLKALKYMGHWIGDLHQPLHVSFKSDKGGNDISVGGVPGCKNMHQLWDTCLVKYFMARHSLKTSRDLAGHLFDHPEINKPESFSGDATVLDWANKIYRITISQSTGYCWMKQGVCTNPVDILTGHVERPAGAADVTYLDQAMRPASETLAGLMRHSGLGLALLLDKELAQPND